MSKHVLVQAIKEHQGEGYIIQDISGFYGNENVPVVACILSAPRPGEKEEKFWQLFSILKRRGVYFSVTSGIEESITLGLSELEIPLPVKDRERVIEIKPPAVEAPISLYCGSQPPTEDIDLLRDKHRKMSQYYNYVGQALNHRHPYPSDLKKRAYPNRSLADWGVHPEEGKRELLSREWRKKKSRALRIDIVYDLEGTPLFGEVKPSATLSQKEATKRAEQLRCYGMALEYNSLSGDLALVLPTPPSVLEHSVYSETKRDIERNLYCMVVSTREFVKRSINTRVRVLRGIEAARGDDLQETVRDIDTERERLLCTRILELLQQ